MIPDNEFVRIRDRSQRRLWSKNAFNCAKCPGEDCPAWWKTSWVRTTVDGHEPEVLEGCSYVLQQLYAQGAVAGGAIIRSGMGRLRDEVVDTVKRASVGIARTIERQSPLLASFAERPALPPAPEAVDVPYEEESAPCPEPT